MMKNILIVFTVLAMASTASAVIQLSVNGRVDPPDTEIELFVSDHAVIDIWGDGATDPYSFILGIAVGGPGVIDVTGAEVIYEGSEGAIDPFDNPDIAELLGLDLNMAWAELTDLSPTPKPLEGTLIDKIDFHCTGLGDVTLMLFNSDGELMDSQIIHQVIPEPITFALLGLGGLFLRRRK